MALFIPLDVANNFLNSTFLTFTNNTDPKNQTIFAGKLSYARISFYQILSGEEEIDTNDANIADWITDSYKINLTYSFNTTDNYTSDYILKHKSGNTLNQIIAIEIFHESQDFADFVNDGGVNIDILETQHNGSTLQAYLYTSPIKIPFQKGILYIKNKLILYGQRRTTATLRFQGYNEDSGFLADNDFILNQTFQVYFEDCELGDTYNPITSACTTCLRESYSFSDPFENQFCTPCNNQIAFCFGGSRIAPRPGFWRYNVNSDKMFECPINRACAGGYIYVNETYSRYAPQGECNFPYQGNLCHQCTNGYAKDSSLSSF